MTFNQLDYALAVARYGSFKHAAEKKNLSQPALSMQIQKLEDEIGVRIFDRTGIPLRITSDGQLFLERAQEIVAATQRLTDFSVRLNEDFSGEIKIGIIPTLAPFLVPLFADQLLHDYPDFRMDIHEVITEKVVNGVRSGDLDVGIISTPINVYGISSIPLFYEKFFIYSSGEFINDGMPVNLSKIKYEHLWLLEEGNCFRDQINNFCDLNKIRKNRQFVYRSNSIDALIRLVDTKGGMTILPELSTLSLSEKQEENVKAIAGKPKAREIAIIVTKNYDKERYIEKLKTYIQNNIPKSMLSSKGLEIVDPEINIEYHHRY
jgi:LysR family transcriptional regulator, hydrogen peroxide-inducible genes activator